MTKYHYTTSRGTYPFEFSQDVEAARNEAETRFGFGGELFKLVPKREIVHETFERNEEARFGARTDFGGSQIRG